MSIKLNQGQREAVNYGDGPLLVIAGAGTGKTRVITERIKHLIESGKADSESILALTFTEKAANEMAERVGDIMPLGYVEPWISTFHSFCDRILRNDGLEIGLDPSYKIISYPEQWLLLRNNLFKMDLKYFRPLGNPTKFISAVLKFISRLQDESINQEELCKYAENIVGVEEECTRWKELAMLYKKYQEFKMEKSLMDFGDLISWTIKLFGERKNILAKYQKQFTNILVDEFQDTNYSQYELIKTLFPMKGKSDRSLVCVGDDSQSIYKFRGAAISNILHFMQDYKDAKTITLIENFRSSQKILDASYKLIVNNNPDTLESQLGISKELISKIEDADINPAVIECETSEQEVTFIIHKILNLLGQEPHLTFKDVAILARANNHLEPFVIALRQKGLPYQLVGNRGLYDRDEIRDIMALLKIIIDPSDGVSLYRVMNIDTINIPYEVISEVLALTQKNKCDLWETIKNSSVKEIESFLELVANFQKEITNRTPTEFIYSLVQTIRYTEPLVKEETIENQIKINNLDLFLNRVKKFEIEYQRESDNIPTVVDFVNYLELIIEAGENPAQAEIEDVDTINLMTVHASKGLEFPIVFVVNMASGRFPTNNKGDLLEIPDELVKEVLPTGDEHIQEERRLCYVAMTRAKKYLYLTYAKDYGGKREKKPSGFINETGIKTEFAEDLPDDNRQESLFGVSTEFRNAKKMPISFVPKFLSFSQIDTYNKCHLQYKYKYVLNIPTMPAHSLSFGSTIHDTLRDFHQKLLFDNVDLEELLSIYKKNWQPLGYMNEEHRKTQFASGEKLLKRYYEDEATNESKHIAFEKAFNIYIEGVKFYGRIDRIDKRPDGKIEIIDYKTGGLKSQKEVDKDSQIAFYAIGAKEALKLNPQYLTYYFLEEGVKMTTARSDDQLNEERTRVKNVITEIKAGNFDPDPGKHCEYCDYKDLCPHAWKG